MKRILAEMPRAVIVSVTVMVGALILLAVLVPFVGGARDAAISLNRKMKTDIDQTTKSITQAKADQAYVLDYKNEFEALIGSDHLVPHTRRAAIVELQNDARIRGLTALNYSFNAATAMSQKAVESQPKSGAYAVLVEDVDIKVGAPFDGPVYGFISDITDAFPGSIVVESVDLRRAPEITPLALDYVSRGQDSQLVTGTIRLSWRTAQAQDKSAGSGK
jgi:hypothetical protein